MSILVTFLTAVSLLGGDPLPNYDVHSERAGNQPRPSLDPEVADAMQRWIDARNSPGKSGNGQPGNSQGESSGRGGPSNSNVGGTIPGFGGKRRSPPGNSVGTQGKRNDANNPALSNWPSGSAPGVSDSGRPGSGRRPNSPWSALDPQFPFGTSANAKDTGSSAPGDAQARMNRLRDNGIIPVGRRPDGSREVAPEAYVLWEGKKNGEKGTPRVFSNWKDYADARDAINASPDTRAYTKEFRSADEAEKWLDEEAKQNAKDEGDRIAKQEADRKAREEAERIAKEEAERKAKGEADRIAKEEAEAGEQAKLQAELKRIDKAQAQLTEARARLRKAIESLETRWGQYGDGLRSRIQRARELGATVEYVNGVWSCTTDPSKPGHQELDAEWERGAEEYRRLESEQEQLNNERDQLARQQEQLDRERHSLYSRLNPHASDIIGSDGWLNLPDGRRLPPPVIFRE